MNKLINFLKSWRYIFFFLFIMAIVIDVFVLKKNSDLFLIFSAFLWILTLIGFRLEYRFSILSAILFLVLSSFFLWIQLRAIAEKLAVWAYIFLLIGIIQQIINNKKRPNDLMSLTILFSLFKKSVIKKQND